MLVAKFLRDARDKDFESEFFMWEKGSDVNRCRSCAVVFAPPLRTRHHCRYCGGIFCAYCCDDKATATVGGESHNQHRCCKGCARGEAPGESIRKAIETKLKGIEKRHVSHKSILAAIDLSYGTSFGIEHGTNKSTSCEEPKRTHAATLSPKIEQAPTSGYFEFINKSKFFCCIKLISGTDGSLHQTLWELPRPSYISIPPGELVSGRFDATSQTPLELYILVGNVHLHPDGFLPGNAGLVYDTKQAAAEAEQSGDGLHAGAASLSRCAAVQNFRYFSSYRIECLHKNVLLKFKDSETGPEPRLGNSVARVGIFTKLTKSIGLGSSSSADQTENPGGTSVNNSTPEIDFDGTNIAAANITHIISS